MEAYKNILKNFSKFVHIETSNLRENQIFEIKTGKISLLKYIKRWELSRSTPLIVKKKGDESFRNSDYKSESPNPLITL